MVVGRRSSPSALLLCLQFLMVLGRILKLRTLVLIKSVLYEGSQGTKFFCANLLF